MTTPAGAAGPGKAVGAVAPSAVAPSAGVPGVAVPGAAAPDKPAAAKTVVKKVTPFKKDGTLRVKMKMIADPEMCAGSMSATAKGVYECGPSAMYLPACWAVRSLKGAKTVVCLRSPDDKKALVWMTDASSLPATTPMSRPIPWQIVLDGGAKCSVRLGGAYGMPPAGYSAVSHNCDGAGGADAVLVKNNGVFMKTNKPHYTVKVLTSAGAVKTAGVAKVVYAGAAPVAATAKVPTGAVCPAKPMLNQLVFDATAAFHVIGKPKCVGSWALSAISDDETGGVMMFQKVAGAWEAREPYQMCPKGKGVPAAFLWTCFVS